MHVCPGSDKYLTRAERLDALDAVLPFHRRDKLARILTDEDVETLRHLVKTGTGDNTLRSLASDLAYIERWCQLATDFPPPWPVPQSPILKFIAHHLWDPAERQKNSDHGMPDIVSETMRVEGLLKVDGPTATGKLGDAHPLAWSTG